MSNIKDFKYSIKTKSGKLIAEEIVAFGGEKNPFPEDWEKQPAVLVALLDYQREMLKKYIDVNFEEIKE